MEAAIIGALVTALLGAIGWMVSSWVRGVSAKLKDHDRQHAESNNRHGLHEVKHATIVAHQEHLIEKSDRIEGKVDKLIGYANGGSKRGTGES